MRSKTIFHNLPFVLRNVLSNIKGAVFIFDLDEDGNSFLSNGVFDADDYALLVAANGGKN